ncbi:DUF551 domain-containing protein [[Clostridium] innocuum]|jgi:hypothetical protein|uniref:DUF551 domain-containing protein n=1 Tax=Clostridium innocuum TaxID=1522 RepID=UPI0015F5EABB|nr:DUF551 domain-containing protein [[Clostridium] innocuum]
MTKDEYLYALASVKMDGDYCDEKQYSDLQKLIEEHFDNPPLKFEDLHEGGAVMNTDGFKHFKLHSDSTLKSLKKDELISYIHMLYHNWSVSDESFCNVMALAEQLQQQSRWIPVEERLPEEDGLYLCSFDDGFIASVDYISGNGFMLWVDSGEVNAWMPLPEPYESKQGDN